MISKSKLAKQTYIFIIFIFLFPVIIEFILYLLNNGISNFNCNIIEWLKSLFAIFKNYMTFYGTALTITFTVYTFIRNQEEYEEDRKKEEAKRYEEQKEANSLKAKELEERRDFYRPTFVIEEDTVDGYEYVKLLMRSDNLYLEQVKYYSSSGTPYSTDKQSVKSGERIGRKYNNLFYITAKTQIGETILFGYLNGEVKIYKYLKQGDKAIIPTFDPATYNQKEIDKIWGTYNDDIKNEKRSLDQILFYNTVGIREKIVFNYNNSLTKTLAAESINKFFKSVFHEIVDEFNLSHFTSISVDESIRSMLLDLKPNIDSIKLSEEISQSNDYLEKQIKRLTYQKENWQLLLQEPKFDIDKFLQLVIDSLHYGRFNLDEEERKINYEALLSILMTVFDNIEIDESLNCKVYNYKSMIYNNLKFKS